MVDMRIQLVRDFLGDSVPLRYQNEILLKLPEMKLHDQFI